MLKASGKKAPDFNPGNKAEKRCLLKGGRMSHENSSVPCVHSGRDQPAVFNPGLKSGADVLDAFSIDQI
jgi:hypothetical protein